MRAKIEAATVRFPRKDGQGVLVPGQMIVTAAHVVSWSTEGGMALGDYYIEEIKAGSCIFKVQPLAVEPVTDIAVLGALDGQVFPDEAEAFEEFCESTAPVSICTVDFPWHSPFPVHVLTHTGRWVSARATQWGVDDSVLSIEASEGIEGGTSGGPVVTNDGLLLGVVSTVGGEPPRTGMIPRVHLAAPVWLVRRMVDPEWENSKMNECWERRAE